MTNTLHRYSDHYAPQRKPDPAPVTDDYIVFAMATKGMNDDGLAEKYRMFLRLALKHNPVNLGDAAKGGIYRPEKTLNPFAHWFRRHRLAKEEILADLEGHTTVYAVFDKREATEAFIRDLTRANLGVSVNIAAPVEDAFRCCQAAGISPHSVEYSLGFHGALDRLPERRILELSTMCGHGMLSHAFTRKMIEWVKEGRRTPLEAARYMARFCSCGIFNTTRAVRIIDQACAGT